MEHKNNSPSPSLAFYPCEEDKFRAQAGRAGAHNMLRHVLSSLPHLAPGQKGQAGGADGKERRCEQEVSGLDVARGERRTYGEAQR